MKTKLFYNLILFVVLFVPSFALAQTNEFTYQGRLTDSAGTAANYDFQFALYIVPSAGTPLGTRERLGVPVSNGAFTVKLDFPAANFSGGDRWLEIRVKPAGSANPYTTLSPRQQITSSPYAILSANAANAETADFATNATNSNKLGGVNADQFVQTTDPRLSDNRNPLPLSTSYIQNRSIAQAGTTNFNINGSGTIGTNLTVNGNFNTSGSGTIGTNLTVNGTLTANLPPGDTSYIQNRTVLQTGTSNFNISGTGTANIFNATTQFNLGGSRFFSNAGTNNTFGGVNAGIAGADSTFFGFNAGNANLATGIDNSFFGSDAGGSNTSGFSNSFFGSDTGDSNSTGDHNSFYGRGAGSANTTQNGNSFFGSGAGQLNTASNNSFFGYFAGNESATGIQNSFFGYRAGLENAGSRNAYFGYQAGAFSLNVAVNENSYFGNSAGANGRGSANSMFGSAAGFNTTSGSSNTFIGTNAGSSNTTGSNNTLLGAGTNFGAFGGAQLSYATAIGAGAVATANNAIVIGRGGIDDGGPDSVFLPGYVRMGNGLNVDGNVSIINGEFSVGSIITGTIDGGVIKGIFNSGGNDDLCRTGSTILLCSSSLRFKTDVRNFLGGLDVVRRLRPITFKWIEDNKPDVGFAAEEIEQIEPLLATYTEQGQIQGVKYKQISTVLVNAVKEQQAQIEQQQKHLQQQQLVIDGLRKLVCQTNGQSEVCKEIQK